MTELIFGVSFQRRKNSVVVCRRLVTMGLGVAFGFGVGGSCRAAKFAVTCFIACVGCCSRMCHALAEMVRTALRCAPCHSKRIGSLNQ